MFKRLKNLISILAAGLIFITMMFATNAPYEVSAASDVTVNLSAEKQVIRGFGGINHPVWIDDLTEAQRKTAFGNGENQLGFSILRVHVDPDKSKWPLEVPTAKSAIEHGAIVFASPWDPPADMVHNVNGQRHLRPDKYAAYVQHLNDFISYMKENGVELYAMSVQNEPDYADQWTWWTPQEMLNFMKNNAGDINCRVMAPESFQYRKNMSDPILNDPKALANMDILGVHLYGTQLSEFKYPLFKQKGAGKDLWMTEVYYPNSSSQADTWPEALETAIHMHNSMVEADFQAYVWWYIRRYYGPMKDDGTISKRGAMMAHFSKYVRPGYVRVDATKSPATNVYVSAYKGDNKVAVVAINKSNSAVTLKFSIQNEKPSKVSSWVTTASSNLSAGTPINVTSDSFTATLPAQSTTTFVADLGSAPTPTPTSNIIYGDLNGDGMVNSTDYSTMKRCLLGTISNIPVEVCDLNGDGNFDSTDYAILKRYLLGTITVFPVQTN
jgi:glucuronoarabinoxylan endo-1,4-beta-xylanase